MSEIVRSNVWCTNCHREFIAELDLSLDGNHVIDCPLCNHRHYRVVSNGVVTEDRWRSSAGPTYSAATTTTTVSINFHAYSVATTAGSFTSQLWLNRSDLNLGTGS